ncbi:hypothetical protein RD792_016621 [Penstemon davidsonii]|uniref:WAT1-related protein n=1 Tax=Penstemon davidsonii TaxID=160366 RepID=A0ABR0CL33_9LAMI|nr:hypothetical protein RD792_016621 [Penstemon davidsonii]
MARGRYYYFYGEILPFAAMVTAECTNVGSNILYKAAVTKGLSYHVFMVYSYAIAALFMIPLAYFIHRHTSIYLIITFNWKFFILGFLGFTTQFLGYKGISFSSPTLGSAMSNLNPASTFILAIIFRMEKLKLRSLSGQAKIIGTAVTIAGAIVVVLYKGPMLITTRNEQLKLPLSSIVLRVMSDRSNWLVGGALLATSYIVSSIWYIVLVKVVKEYPAVFVVVFFYNLFACIISVPGIVGSGFGVMVHTWGLNVKGPVYVALFKPLSIAIAAILGVIFLRDNLYLGSVIGSLVISFGFYTVIWGKSNEGKNDDVSNGYNIESPNDAVVPLLKPLK